MTPTVASGIRAAGGMQKDLAAAFGVTVSTISNIVTRKTWRWVL